MRGIAEKDVDRRIDDDGTGESRREILAFSASILGSHGVCSTNAREP